MENPRKLKFEALDAAVLPRVLPDVDTAAINTNYALDSGLSPIRDGIYIEQDSPYANVIAVRAKDQERPEVRKLVEVYQSAEIRKFIAETTRRRCNDPPKFASDASMAMILA